MQDAEIIITTLSSSGSDKI